MNDLEFHQHKAIEALELLQEICREYGFRLYLLSGTTLGAKRHKGFIPWDDDIDVGLLYNDWYKLREVLYKEISGEFEYLDCIYTRNFPRLFGKITYNKRSCVDIFLISKWPTNVIKERILWRLKRLATEFYKLSIDYKSPIKPNVTKAKIAYVRFIRLIYYLVYLVVKPFFKKESCLKLAQTIEKYAENSNYDCYINLYSIYRMKKEKIKKEWIENPSLIVFEGKEYYTVGNVDAYLTNLYGDYMTPPPDKSRNASHLEIFEENSKK